MLTLILAGTVVLSGCSSAPTEEEVDGAWDACVDGFNARPKVVEQAWDDEYEATWRIGKLWWEFGAGDICDTLKRELDVNTWVEHATTPSWYVDQYLD
ncbi:hypothetical protein [Microbacterium maritypicum]|uniref:hypothetical protein n=1 Tax=Microbacterium maritypicum TaxID=33918 RepID=UPI0037F493EB